MLLVAQQEDEASHTLPILAGFSIHPGGRWSLEVGQVYVITVEAFAKSSTRVYISDVSRSFVFVPCSFTV